MFASDTQTGELPITCSGAFKQQYPNWSLALKKKNKKTKHFVLEKDKIYKTIPLLRESSLLKTSP